MLLVLGLLSSAQLVISRLEGNWKKSHRNMLNGSGPSMGPYGTPKIISGHELYVPFSLTLCFRLSASCVSYCGTIFRAVATLLEKILYQIHQELKQLELNFYIPVISMIPCSAIQKCRSYLFRNFHKRGSLELWGKVYRTLIGIEFSRSIKLVLIQDLIKLVWELGVRTAEFNLKWKKKLF